MIKKTVAFAILYLCTFYSLCAQNDDSLFARLRGITNSGVDFFNVDGIEITSQTIPDEFSVKNIAKKFKRYDIKEKDLAVSDSLIGYKNFYVSKSAEATAGIVQNTSYYFVASPSNGIIAVTFAALNKKDQQFERHFVKLLYNNAIPRSVYEPMKIDSIDFAGRKIALGGSCHWMGVNNVQCSGYGQMNWSVHKDLEDASIAVHAQYNQIKQKKGGKIVAEDSVNVVFEGTAVKAIKAVYDFKGVSSLLVGISGGKTLTIYCVAVPVRQYYVSCVMSFWNNDVINASGLPPLLEKVMTPAK